MSRRRRRWGPSCRAAAASRRPCRASVQRRSGPGRRPGLAPGPVRGREEEGRSASRWTCFGHAAEPAEPAAVVVVGTDDAVAAVGDIAVAEYVAVAAAVGSAAAAVAVVGTAAVAACAAAGTP